MRVYAVGMAVLVLEHASVLLLLRQGTVALGVNAAALAVSVAVSWTAAGLIGLAGAAAGNVVAWCATARSCCDASRSGSVSRCASCRTGAGSRRRLAYAIGCVVLIRVAVDLLIEHGALARLALGACNLALVYAPILWHWKRR